jgi:hypothetical protein
VYEELEVLVGADNQDIKEKKAGKSRKELFLGYVMSESTIYLQRD